MTILIHSHHYFEIITLTLTLTLTPTITLMRSHYYDHNRCCIAAITSVLSHASASGFISALSTRFQNNNTALVETMHALQMQPIFQNERTTLKGTTAQAQRQRQRQRQGQKPGDPEGGSYTAYDAYARIRDPKLPQLFTQTLLQWVCDAAALLSLFLPFRNIPK